MLPVNSATEDSHDSGNISFISLLCTPDPTAQGMPSARASCTHVGVFCGSSFFKSGPFLGIRMVWNTEHGSFRGRNSAESVGFFPVIVCLVINSLLGESYYLFLK